MTNGPDYGKLKMARLLVELDASHTYTVPADILADAKQTIAWQTSVAKTAEWQRNRALEETLKRQAILDADVAVTSDTAMCEARVFERSYFDSRGHACGKRAKFVRTWTDNQKNVRQSLLCGTHRQIKGQYGWPF